MAESELYHNTEVGMDSFYVEGIWWVQNMPFSPFSQTYDNLFIFIKNIIFIKKEENHFTHDLFNVCKKRFEYVRTHTHTPETQHAYIHMHTHKQQHRIKI